MTKLETRSLSLISRLDHSAESVHDSNSCSETFNSSFRVKPHLSKENASNSELLHESGGKVDSYIYD